MTPASILHRHLNAIEQRFHMVSLLKALADVSNRVEWSGPITFDQLEGLAKSDRTDTLLISPALEAELMQQAAYRVATYQYSVTSGRQLRRWHRAWVIVSPLLDGVGTAREACWMLPTGLEVDVDYVGCETSLELSGETISAAGEYRHVTKVKGEPPVALIHDGSALLK